MKITYSHRAADTGRRALDALRLRFSLKEDKAEDADIDQRLRTGVEMKGTNLWVLMFAILIASIGLNVNSTAVIIGAMLISPLMGPIMGIGYGVGISDFVQIRLALKNFGIAILLALLTSTAYFAVSPLTSIQSELLSRTNPSIWDVLIALFGGLAGIVATTRKEKSNAIPGVAIATALMPPLCTAGYGLAAMNLEFFLGAFYLFTINSVFIAASSAIIVRAFHLPKKHFVDERVAGRVHICVGIVVVLTALPSLYLAYQLVGEEFFKSRAVQFVRDNLESNHSHVVSTSIDPKARKIEVTLVGEVLKQSALTEVAGLLPGAGLAGTELKVFQTGEQRIDIAALKSTLLGDLYKGSQLALETKERIIAQMRAELTSLKATQAQLSGVPAELHALYPHVSNVILAESPEWNDDTGWSTQKMVLVGVRSSKPLGKEDRRRIEQWIRTRLNAEHARVIVESQAK